MKISLSQYERIIKFLDADMSFEEMEAFEQELSSNPAMREQLDFENNLRDLFETVSNETGNEKKNPDNEDVSDSVEQIRSLTDKADIAWNEKESAVLKAQDSRSKRISGIKSWVTIAAAACLITIGFLVWHISKTSSDSAFVKKNTDKVRKNGTRKAGDSLENSLQKDSIRNNDSPKPMVNLSEIAKKYYKKDTVPFEQPRFLSPALKDFASGNYSSIQHVNLKKLSEFDILSAPEDVNSKQNLLQAGYYYQGLSFIETKNHDRAVENLKWVIDSAQNSELISKAQWYLALEYLKINNYNSAKSLLHTLANKNNSPYQSKASEILRISD